MTPASLLVALLSISPPGVPSAKLQAPAEPPAPGVSDGHAGEYQAALERVRTAQRMANEDPQRGAVQLRDALQLLQDFGPTLAKDPEGQDLRTMAQLTLARALLATDDADGARAVMDEALRTARGDPLPTKQFGPGLAALHKERSGVLGKQGSATIEVQCHVPCRVYVNERPTEQLTEGLPPGRYRVWVEATNGHGESFDPIQSTIELAEGRTAPLEFGEPETDGGGNGDKPPPTHKRMLPRWSEILIMTAGAAAIGTGAALWAIHGRCPGGGDPNDTGACPNVYLTRTPGIATLAAGGAVLLTGTVLLSVDEVRIGRARGSSVSLVWSLRF